jgi:RIO-like serine/threonine protein kinase
MHNRYKGRLCRVLNSDLKVLSAKPSFYDTFKVTPNETLGNFTDMKRISQEFSDRKLHNDNFIKYPPHQNYQ